MNNGMMMNNNMMNNNNGMMNNNMGNFNMNNFNNQRIFLNNVNNLMNINPMMYHNVMSQLNPIALQNFANQLAEYERKMESECLKLANAIGQLGSGWQAGDYDKFADSINSKITMIRKELSSNVRKAVHK